METKTCKDCKKTLSLDCFQPIRKDNRQWFSSYCKECNIIRSQDSYLKRNYGVTLEEKNKMIQDQGNKCGLCGNDFVNKKDTHLDHCHASGKVRKVLCGSCNVGLGYFKDNPELLKKAAEYIEGEKLA
jgi:hypothetical protein